MTEAPLHQLKRRLLLLTPRGWGSSVIGPFVPGQPFGFLFAVPAPRAANAADPETRPFQPSNDNHFSPPVPAA